MWPRPCMSAAEILQVIKESSANLTKNLNSSQIS